MPREGEVVLCHDVDYLISRLRLGRLTKVEVGVLVGHLHVGASSLASGSSLLQEANPSNNPGTAIILTNIMLMARHLPRVSPS